MRPRYRGWHRWGIAVWAAALIFGTPAAAVIWFAWELVTGGMAMPLSGH